MTMCDEPCPIVSHWMRSAGERTDQRWRHRMVRLGAPQRWSRRQGGGVATEADCPSPGIGVGSYAQARHYSPDACDERASRSHGVGGKREQPWQLRWTRDERNGHSPSTDRADRAARVEGSERSRRQGTFRRIANRAQDGERHASGGGNARHRAALQIGRRSAGSLVEAALFRHAGYHCTGGKYDVVRHAAQHPRQVHIGGKAVAAGNHSARHDDGAGTERRIQSASEAETDQRGGPRGHERARCRMRAGGRPAADGYRQTKSVHDACLRDETDHDRRSTRIAHGVSGLCSGATVSVQAGTREVTRRPDTQVLSSVTSL